MLSHHSHDAPSRRVKSTGSSSAGPAINPRPAQYSAYVPSVELTVLRREWVDGRRDHPHPLQRHPVRDISRSREHKCVRVREVATQELPPGVRVGGGVVPADVTAPNHLRAQLVETLDQACRLRVVEKHDIAAPNLSHEIDKIPLEHPFIMLVLGRSESLPAVHRAVQRVMHPPGDGEELRVTVQNQPSGVHACAASIGQQTLQHLRHPATVRGGIDVPHHATSEKGPSPGGGRHQPAPLQRAKDRLHHVKRHRLNLDLLHAPILPRQHRWMS